MKELFSMIEKRRSVRKFDENLKVSDAEMTAIKERLDNLEPLYPEIKVSYRIVPREETNVKWGEYVVIVYSEEKDGYLRNIGYMYEEFDLWLASLDIGACWYGMGRPTEEQKAYDGGNYAVMFAFGKSRPEDFRGAEGEFSRKSLDDLWWGDLALDAAKAARLSPSACNSQPWLVKCDGDTLTVYQRRSFITKLAKSLNSYFNIMDVGIFMRILEISLLHYGYEFTRELLSGDEDKTLSYAARYEIKGKIE